MEKTIIKQLYKYFVKHPQISTDSREIKDGSIYFALKGENFNGNKFAADAIDKGASFAIVDEEKYCINSQYILVEDGLKTLQSLAKFHRQQMNIPIIGITGSNGKTTTKELIHAVLSKKYNCIATKGNLNNHIGVPLSLLSIQSETEIAIIEMGANHQGEIEFLCSIAQPNYGLITNIGKAHLEGFGGIEGVKKGKSELYKHLKNNKGQVFVNGDDTTLMELCNDLPKKTYGIEENNDCFGKLIQSHPTIKANWKCNDNSGIIEAQLYGAYNFYNIMAAICIGNYFEVEAKKISVAISNYQSSNNRSQYIQREQYEVFLDAYNANPSSMQVAIENFDRNTAKKKVLILGDMFEVGSQSKEEHHQIIELIKTLSFDKVSLVGKNFFIWVTEYPEFTFFETTQEAKDWFQKFDKTDFQFLIKGSRRMSLERIIQE